MKPITELSKNDIRNLKIICFDVDGVTVKKGTKIKEVETKETTTLTIKTNKLSKQMLEKMIELKKYYVIAIASGRSSLYLTELYYKLLWNNAALISENGIFTLMNGNLIQNEKFSYKTLMNLRNIFIDLQKLEGKHKDFIAFEPKQFLITLHACSEIMKVYDIVKKYDTDKKLYCWWNGEAFDIAPKRLNKGAGLKNLAKHLNIDISKTMAIGNGPNDKDMIDVAGIGITTEPKTIKADFYTTGSQHLGGEELVDVLLKLSK